METTKTDAILLDACYNTLPVNFLYHKTEVFFFFSSGRGDLYRKWHKLVSKYSLERQNKDGSWISPRADWPTDNKKFSENIASFSTRLNLQIYSTALFLLPQEIYYAYVTSNNSPIRILSPDDFE